MKVSLSDAENADFRRSQLTSEWKHIMTIGASSIPLDEIECAHCGNGEKFIDIPNKIMEISDKWREFWEISHQLSYEPIGEAFKSNSDRRAQKYGILDLKCKGCENHLFVHYVLESKSEDHPAKFWCRLTMPGYDFADLRSALYEQKDKNREIRGELFAAIRARNILVMLCLTLFVLCLFSLIIN